MTFDPISAHDPRSTTPRFPRRAAALALLYWSVSGCTAHEVTAGPAAPPVSAAEVPQAANPATPAPATGTSTEPGAPTIHGFTMTRLDGSSTSLATWAGKVLLIVNTASKCGFTPQYEGLQQLHAKYSPRGFAVLGFPSNDFGGQEPGTSQEIATFCTSIYAVNFPMFEKIKTVGSERSPLYALLSDARGAPKWNFHKYLIDKQGRPVQAWPSAVTPGSPEIASAIEAQLAVQ